MKPDLRISVKDYRQGKNLKVLLYQLPYGSRRFLVRMNGSRWPKSRQPRFGHEAYDGSAQVPSEVSETVTRA